MHSNLFVSGAWKFTRLFDIVYQARNDQPHHVVAELGVLVVQLRHALGREAVQRAIGHTDYRQRASVVGGEQADLADQRTWSQLFLVLDQAKRAKREINQL